MGDYAIYKALQSYKPPTDDPSLLEFEKDDIFEIYVQSPYTQNQSDRNGWLLAYNLRTKKQGYIPVECVKLMGSEMNKTIHHPSALGVAVSDNIYKIKEPEKTYEHRADPAYFLTPVLCKHCKDYIWGQGHIGVKCKGKRFSFQISRSGTREKEDETVK